MQLSFCKYGIWHDDGKCGISLVYSLLASVTIYTGAFQFVLITFLSSGAAWLTIAVTAFLMNEKINPPARRGRIE